MPYPSRTDKRSIVEAAIDVLNDQGLDRLSLRAIAGHLGVRQPALYHHVPNKAALLDDVAAAVLDRWHTQRSPRHGENWEDFLARYARNFRRAMLTVRDGARLVASTGSRSPAPERAMRQLSVLEDAGFSTTDAILALIAVTRYTIGSTLEQQTARDDGDIVLEVGDAAETDHPTALFLAATREVVALGQDHEFDFGLTAVIRGLRPPST
ncbi:TetR/AcrR family transcriptional regulator C-terminal domain-containing protein [Corynebacterium sp.]|uniref:TetR/AcrR family transcriptional regulator C-terminal domain-containing protein n=1 Tax=Corynebacterium sp. TaxID=1720 RepID=UPI003B3B920E